MPQQAFTKIIKKGNVANANKDITKSLDNNYFQRLMGETLPQETTWTSLGGKKYELLSQVGVQIPTYHDTHSLTHSSFTIKKIISTHDMLATGLDTVWTHPDKIPTFLTF